MIKELFCIGKKFITIFCLKKCSYRVKKFISKDHVPLHREVEIVNVPLQGEGVVK